MKFFDGLIENVCWPTKKLLSWESAIYHSIKLPFDAEVAEKFLNGIYYLTSVCNGEAKNEQMIREVNYC